MDDIYSIIGANRRKVPTQEEIDAWNAGKVKAILKCSECGKDFEIDWHLEYPLGVLALTKCGDCSTDVMTVMVGMRYD